MYPKLFMFITFTLNLKLTQLIPSCMENWGLLASMFCPSLCSQRSSQIVLLMSSLDLRFPLAVIGLKIEYAWIIQFFFTIILYWINMINYKTQIYYTNWYCKGHKCWLHFVMISFSSFPFSWHMFHIHILPFLFPYTCFILFLHPGPRLRPAA